MPPKEPITPESIKTLVDKYTEAVEAWVRKHKSFSILLEEIEKKIYKHLDIAALSILHTYLQLHC